MTATGLIPRAHAGFAPNREKKFAERVVSGSF